MKSNLVKNEKGVVTVDVVADKQEWQDAQKKAFEKLKAKLKLKGFRDGKSIPDELARPHINEGDILNEGFRVIAQSLYEKVLTENKITPIIEPDIKFNKVDKDNLEISFEISVYPEVTLGQYKDIEVAKENVEVGEQEINQAINRIALDNAMLKQSDKPARMGDTVVLDFVGYIDRKPFDGGSANNYSLELGSNQFIPGFEQQLVGVKAGDVKEINVTFPKQYVKDLAGKDAIFKCTIHEVKEKLIPDVNDEFVKTLEMEGVETVEQLKEKEKSQILANKQQQAERSRFNKLLEKIVENSKIEMSSKLVDREVEAMKNNIEQRVTSNGLTFDQYLEITNQSLEQLEKTLRVDAEKNLKTMLVLGKIAEVEKLNVTDKDVDEEIEKMSKLYNRSVDEVKKAIANQMTDLRQNLQERKIEAFLKENNFKETK